VERIHFGKAGLPGNAWRMPKKIAPGIDPSPLDDLLFHGGKVVPQMEFQNVFLGSADDWTQSDIDSIDASITRAMQDKKLNNVIVQYFPGAPLECDPRPSFIHGGEKPVELDEPDVQETVVQLFDEGRIKKNDLATTIFNLVLPIGTVLRLGSSTSTRGLGGYHGSVHITRGGKAHTIYYSANVFSTLLPDGTENGIVVFAKPWKNVVATLYHELNEFRTDADVGDAIATGNNDLLGWTSRRGHEIGDQPIAVAASLGLVFKEIMVASDGTRAPVQFMYSNAAHGAEGPLDNPVGLTRSPGAQALRAKRGRPASRERAADQHAR
jgi:hypothetical protein